MKQYKLKEDFAGKKAGEIFKTTLEYNNTVVSWKYKGTFITLDSTSELLEEVKDEPLFYTNEDEVYFDGKKNPVYKEDKYYLVGVDNTVQTTIAYACNNAKLYPSNKRFLTLQTAEDYIKLQQAIKDSGLKIGDNFSTNKKEYTCSGWNNKSWEKYSSSPESLQKVEKFIIYEEVCSFISDRNFIFSLKQFSKPKLLFGDKEVYLNYMISEGRDSKMVTIACNNETCTYQYAKKFREAITTIQNFRFGSQELHGGITKNMFKIGCTTGTLEQIDKILEECEKLLKS